LEKKGIFILGFRKCGTTNLFDIICKNSSFPKLKEPQFFALSDKIMEDNIQWYRGLYKNNERIVDGSTLYIHDPESIRRIESQFTNYKLILSLRDPAKRFYSAYWHMKVKGQNIENRTINEVICMYESTNQLSLETETELLERCNSEGKISLNYLDTNYHRKKFKTSFNTDIKDFKAFFRYWGESNYSEYLSRVNNNYMEVVFEQLLKHPEKVISKLESYLELKDLPKSIPENRNKTVYRVKWTEPFRKYIGAKSKAYLKSKLGKSSPKIDEKTYNRIRSLLEPEYNYWFEKKPELENYWAWKN
jgi:hypothetical protein